MSETRTRRKQRQSFARRMVLLAAVPALGAVTPLVVFPTIASRHGAEGWAEVGVGFAAGAAISVIVEMGWGLNGPQLIAGAQSPRRARLLRTSVLAKYLVFTALSPLAIIIAMAASPQHSAAAVFSGLHGLTSGLSVAWFFIGVGTASRVLLYESVPRLVGALAAVLALRSGAGLEVQAMIQAAINIVIPVAAVRACATLPSGERITRTEVFGSIRSQVVAVTARGASAVYTALPVVVVSLIAPSAAAQFSAVERLQRMALAVLAAIPSAFQSWVGASVSPAQRRRRVRLASFATVLVGSMAAALFALLVNPIADVVFAGAVEIPAPLAVVSGAIVAVTMASRATGSIALVAVGNIRAIATSAVAGAVVALPLVALGSMMTGTLGGLVAELIVELVVLSVQLAALKVLILSAATSQNVEP